MNGADLPSDEAAAEHAAAVAAEIERLKSGTGVLERLQAHYGDALPEVLRARAEANLSAQAAKRQDLKRPATPSTIH